MGYRKIAVEGIPLTLELAREFAALPPLPGEREIKPARREFLLQRLRDGQFVGPSWARGICRADGQTIRLDGQHSSNLLTSLPSDVQFPAGLIVTIDTFEFDSMADSQQLFDLFNHPRSTRSNEDAMGLFKARVPTLQEIPRKLLQKIANGIAEQQRSTKDGELFQPRFRGMYFEQEHFAAFACWVASHQEDKNAGFLTRTGIVAEMLSDWLHDESSASEFWAFVFRENHPEPDHETRTLAETFRAWSVQRKHKPDEYRRKAATAWKHFLRESRAAA